jgi:hypothetical protein
MRHHRPSANLGYTLPPIVGVLLGVLIELVFAASAAEVVGLALVLAAADRLLRIDLHAANYVLLHLIQLFLY